MDSDYVFRHSSPVNKLSTITIVLFLSASLVSCSAKFSGAKQNTLIRNEGLPEAYPGYSGVYPDFTLSIDERFDLYDEYLWHKGDGSVGDESLCRFQPQGVQFHEGKLALLIQKEAIASGWSNDHERIKDAYDYTCGEYRSNQAFLYGRVETRIKNPDPTLASGYISSLFTYRNIESEGYHWREIDIETEGKRPTQFQSNLIFGEGTSYWYKTREWGAFEKLHDTGNTFEWRVYAFEWTPDKIIWFVDGVVVRTLTQAEAEKTGAKIPELAMNLMLNFWIPNDIVQDNFGGNKRDNTYPMTVHYDWFRYYNYTPN
ncbi:MAG: endo-1,3-1,4-beta-glycanase ExoK [Lentisphaeria bacterium]|jgi:endo-1,3-1,4-beta-glycanase ExoK